MVTKKRALDALTIVVLAIFLFPFLWIVLTSLKPTVVSWQMPPVFIFTPTLKNYFTILFKEGFSRYVINSAIVACISTLLALIIGVPAAFSISRLEGTIKNTLLGLLLIGYAIPAIVVALPLYLVFVHIRLQNTYLAVIVAHTVYTLAFTIWLLKGFFKDIPPELEESAMIDGCGYLKALIYVVMPLALPGIIAIAVLCAILSWNDFLYALILTGPDTRTLPPGLISYFTPHQIIWGKICAGATLAVMPILAFSIFVQRYFISGIMSGAVK